MNASPGNQDERWLPVAGFEGLYEVSNRGRVRRLTGAMAGKEVIAGKKKDKPYFRVRLVRAHTGHWHNVHSLVCAAFHGPCPVGLECRHKDSDPENNDETNLAWGTRAENTADRVAAGSSAGERNGRAVMTADIARIIRSAAGSHRKIAAAFGVGVSTVLDIKKGRTWRNV